MRTEPRETDSDERFHARKLFPGAFPHSRLLSRVPQYNDMIPALPNFSALFLSLALFSGFASGKDFEQEIRPFLTKYCMSCHGPEKQKAKLRLDTLDADLINGSEADMWQEVLDLVNVSEMPPEDAKLQPKPEERGAAVELLTAEMRKVLEARRSTGGRNVLRRLTAYEYDNTLRDLLHLNLRFASDLPPEGKAAEGFKNNAGVLGTSALHIEYFERIARDALGRILLAPDEKPPAYFVRIDPERAFKPKEAPDNPRKKPKRGRSKSGSNSYNLQPLVGGKPERNGLFKLDFGEASPDGAGILLAGNRPQDPTDAPFAKDRKIGGALGDGRSGYQPEFRAEIYEIPHDSPVLVKIHAAAVPGKGGVFPRLSFELGSFRGNGVSDQKEAANVEIRSTEPRTYEFLVHGANFPFQSNKPGRPSYFRIFNDYRRGTDDLAYADLPKLFIDWVEIESNHFPEWPTAPKRAILVDSPHREDEPSYVRDVLRNFMKRAYRRPVAEREVERKAALFARLRHTEASFEHTLVSTLAAVLCSSHFLLVAEPAPRAVAEGEPIRKRALNEFELASRLSYFLWSSMPDDALFALAESGELSQPVVLRGQVLRMVRDPKALAFSTHFASQWLDLAGIRRLAVNPEYFTFEETTKDLFEQETIRFLHHIAQENLPIDNFIDSDFVVTHHKLAKHYRIPGVSGGFHVRKLGKEHHRGGLLTQAGMLFGNSTGSETHPIRRGMWVLERMLDAPPPPPPPNVPDLPEPEAQDEAGLSLKERLFAHANVQSCKDCHSKIDPWGVAFENYNALGQWREGELDPNVKPPHQKVVVDPSTRLRNGKQIPDLDALKAYLLSEKKDQFRRAVVSKTLAYALGRYLELSDRPAVDYICQTLEKEGDRFQTLLVQIALSEPFLTK